MYISPRRLIRHVHSSRVVLVSDLVARRLLGQTKLSPKIANSAPNNTGVFDYAHLRAPMPKNVVSGIFKKAPSKYYLMRRSRDGYVSATGMFKATFPYAEATEEEEERRYIKSLPVTSQEETAGNVWVPPELAMTLAEEYQITPWIKALLDPAPVASPDNADSKAILAPPAFEQPKPATSLAPPTPISLAGSRARRSASPTKLPKKAAASPRKRSTKAKSDLVEPRTTRSRSQSVDVEETISEVKTEATTTLLQSVEEEPSAEKSDKTPRKPSRQSKKKLIDIGGEALFAAGAGAPPTKEETAKMLEEAKQMVSAAKESTDVPEAGSADEAAKEAPLTNGDVKSKRKAENMSTGDKPEEAGKEGEEEASELAEPSAKKVKTEIQVKKETVRRRALFGLSATVAVG
ncbi:hypothetical protein IMZ48_42380 [Candidatus Bathyarchaeota archaeon]|nr:hypothetical protein [Candidatus Bathyarchaeota archaeon]